MGFLLQEIRIAVSGCLHYIEIGYTFIIHAALTQTLLHTQHHFLSLNNLRKIHIQILHLLAGAKSDQLGNISGFNI